MIIADINARIVYRMANIRKLASKNANVTTKNMAKNIAATFIGQCNMVSNTLASIMVAIGNANNNNNKLVI